MPDYMAAIPLLSELSERLGSQMGLATAQLAEAPEGAELDHAIAVSDRLAGEWDGLAADFEPVVAESLTPMTDLIEQTAVASVRLAQIGEYTAENAASLEPYRGLAEVGARNALTVRQLATSIRSVSGVTARLRESGGRLASIMDRIAVTSERLARLADLIPPAPPDAPPPGPDN